MRSATCTRTVSRAPIPAAPLCNFRQYAVNNPDAHFYKKPITLDDHQSSRWIAEPAIRLFDCCQETDGSVALVITSAERSAASKDNEPILIGAAAQAGLFEEE